MNIYNNKILSDEELVCKLRGAAKTYAQYADKDVLIVYADNRNGPFYAYEFHAGRENFQHLAGVKSPNGAIIFFERCLDDVNLITRKEIVPNDNIKVTSAKINVLKDAIDLTKAKAYKIGEKNLITLFNSFHIAIGNNQSVMGLEKRSYYLPVPVTVLDRSIYEFCTKVSTIYLVMLKSKFEKQYSIVFYEITKNILQKAEFGKEVLDKIKC